MDNKGSLSEKSCKYIMALLTEPKIYDRVTAPVKGRERYKKVNIVAETGTIMLGKYSWSGFGGFWNNLIKCKKDISFEEFALRVWDALSDMTAGTNAGEAVLEGLGRETLMEGIRNKRWDWLVERFMEIDHHLTKDEYWSSKGKDGTHGPSKDYNQHCTNDNDGVVITVASRQPRTFKVVDAIGDVFEVLNVRWIGGR